VASGDPPARYPPLAARDPPVAARERPARDPPRRGAGGGARTLVGPVQIDPIKPMLKATGSARLKLKCDDLLLNFAIDFNMRGYTLVGPVGAGDGRGGVAVHGLAVQVHPLKPTLKPPGTERLKLQCDILPSTIAFKFNLRRYTMGGLPTAYLAAAACLAAGAYTRPLFGST